MACATIAERGVSTAIVVNRAELATQWRERPTEFLDIDPKHIGQLGAGRRKRTGIIDIITLQCGPVRHTIFRDDELASNELRNKVIANDIHNAHREGRTCLALTNRIEHVETLAALLRPLNVRVFVLHGQLGARERLAVRAEISAIDGRTPFVLIATDKVAGEGFDLPDRKSVV